MAKPVKSTFSSVSASHYSFRLLQTKSYLSLSLSLQKDKKKKEKMEFFMSKNPKPGSIYKMADGTKVETEVVSDDSSTHLDLFLITQCMQKDKDMIVGFDAEWSLVVGSNEGGKVEPRPLLVKLGTRHGCVLIRLDQKSMSAPQSLKHFFLLKDIIFVGVHIKEDLAKLKSDFGIEVRNAVELSDLAAKIMGQPCLVAYGVRGLARRVLCIETDKRPLSVSWAQNWAEECLTNEQIECATVDAYLTYRIGEKLLANSD